MRTLIFAGSPMIVRGRPYFGLPTIEHARKIPAWTLRLDGAREGLEGALRMKDRTAVVRALEDVSFWTGRLVADGLSVEDAPEHAGAVRGATASILRARDTLARARAFLTGPPGNGRR